MTSYNTICSEDHISLYYPDYKKTLEFLGYIGNVPYNRNSSSEMNWWPTMLENPWDITEQKRLEYRYCICGSEITNNVNFVVTSEVTDHSIIVCSICKQLIQLVLYPTPKHVTVDDGLDHIARSIEFRHVILMMKKAAHLVHIPTAGSEIGLRGITRFGNIVSLAHYHFTYEKVGEHYEYCVCGHAIKNNFVATCIETGCRMTVGSECIKKVARQSNTLEMRHITKRCKKCGVTDMTKKRKAICYKCSGLACKACGKEMANAAFTYCYGCYYDR